MPFQPLIVPLSALWLSYLHEELALGEVLLPLLGLQQRTGRILLGKTATDGTGLLGAEIEREELLVLVEQAELCPLLGVDNGEHAGDGLADVVAVD